MSKIEMFSELLLGLATFRYFVFPFFIFSLFVSAFVKVFSAICELFPNSDGGKPIIHSEYRITTSSFFKNLDLG